MKNDVVVIMSTYNGEKTIERQLDSIFRQKAVDVIVVIRDDHSTDNTVDVVKKYKEKKGKKIIIIEGENEGYAKSFWDALCIAPEGTYYAFSDQDDVWNEDKLIKCIAAFDTDDKKAQLVYCSMIRTDPNFNICDEQVKVLRPEELTKKLVFTQTYNYGASTVFNNKARQLACRHFPIYTLVPHDAWIGLLCFWFGSVFYLDERLYYWVRYDSSVTGAGTKKAGRWYRIRATLKGESYMNPSKDLVTAYDELLSEDDKVFLNRVMSYKSNLKDKMLLLFDKEFKRSSFMGTIALKWGILSNRF